MRAATYARVSSRAQAERHSIDSQFPVLRAFVLARGWSLVGEYVDDGRTARSGHLEARTGFTRLVGDAAAGRLDVVVVFDLDRLTRSEDLTERGAILGAFQRAGVKIAIATSGQVLDLSSEVGDLFSGLQAFFAAAENRKRSERTLAGKARAVAEGRPPATPPPYGFAYSRAAGFGHDPERVRIVRDIYRRVARGESGSSIDRRLRDRGVPGPRGGAWPASATYKIAVNTAYRGSWVVSKKRGWTLTVPRVVDDEVWYAAQDTLRNVRGRPRSRAVYLLEGIAVCELCNAKVFISSHGDARPPTYACARRLRPDEHGRCDGQHWRTADVDAALWTSLMAQLARPTLVAELVENRAAAASADGAAWQSDLDGARRALERLVRRERTVLDQHERGNLSDAALEAELGAMAARRRAAESQVAGAHRAAAGAKRAQESAQELARVAAAIDRATSSASATARRSHVRTFLGGRAVYLGKEGIRYMLGLSTRPESVRRAISGCWTTDDSQTRGISVTLRVLSGGRR